MNNHESIATFHPVIMIHTKVMQLKVIIDEVIQYAFESGLILKWEYDSQRKKELLMPYEVKPGLTLTNIGALYFLCGGGYAIAIMIFLVERFTQYKMQQDNRSQIWMHLERSLDGERHYLTNIPEKLMAGRSIGRE